MRDQVAAKLRELMNQLDEYEDVRFSECPKGSNDYIHGTSTDSMTPFDAQAISGFIRCIAKQLNDTELNILCDRIDARAEHILKLEEGSDEAWDAAKEQSFWEDKKFFSATDIGLQLGISHSGTKVNKILESLGLLERANGGWMATAKAEGLAFQRGLEEGQKPYIQWDKSIIQYLTTTLP